MPPAPGRPTRRIFLLLPLALALVALVGACGGEDDGDAGASPTVAPTRPAGATPDGGVSGTLVWNGAPYLHTLTLSLADVSEADLVPLGEAELGPERLPEPVFQRPEAPWELLTRGAEDWLLWEPLSVAEAQRRLADELGLAAGDVRIVSVEEVEWPDSCLGAPADDEVCAEVITAGFRVTLEAEGEEHVFRTDQRGQVRAEP